MIDLPTKSVDEARAVADWINEGREEQAMSDDKPMTLEEARVGLAFQQKLIERLQAELAEARKELEAVRWQAKRFLASQERKP